MEIRMNIININSKINLGNEMLTKIDNLFKNKNSYFKYLWLIPIIYGIIIVAIFGVNVIIQDEWELVSLYDNIEQNGLFDISSLKMLLAQHNEHRILFPRLILLISVKLTHFNSKICMFILQIMVITVYGIIIKYLKKNVKKDHEICTDSYSDFIMTLFVLMIGFACFSSIQFENFLRGFQVAFYMAIFGSVISLYFFHQYIVLRENKYCFLSLFFGIISSFSCMHGIFIWPVIIINILLVYFVSRDRLIINKIIMPIIVGISCYIIYFYKWKIPGGNLELNHDVYLIVKYFFGSIGGIYNGLYSKLTVILGGITVLSSVILVLIFFIQRNIKEVFFPIGLIGYSYASLLAVAIRRADLGVEFSTSSRYMSLSIMSYIGIIMIIYQCFISPYDKNIKINMIMKYGKKVFIIFIALFSILLIFGNLKGILYSKDHANFSNENISILQNYEQQSIDKLNRLYPFGTYENAYIKINKLKKYKLNVFSNTLYIYNAIPIEKLSYLKSIKLNHWLGFGQESFSWDNEFVSIPSGWVIDYISKKEYTTVFMKVNNKFYKTADHLSSPDVAKYFENSYYNNVRFSFSFPVADMNLGENNFSALVILNDGLTYYETDVIKIYKDENGGILF